jgi:hypothetical protein
MARPYSAGGVSIAESNNRCCRPAAVAACGLQAFSGPTFPPLFPAPSLLLPTAITSDLGQGEEVRRRGPA